MGLNLNYTPNRLVDITTLTEDQWLSWRRKGIGGSDVAVALNSSPYRTARDLYYDKIGVVMSDDGPDRSITFQIGHLPYRGSYEIRPCLQLCAGFTL